MNSKTFRKQQKALLRRKAKEIFVAPLPEAIFAPPADSFASPEASTKPQLSRAQRIILEELHRFQLELHRLFLRSSQRMLLAGAKEARQSAE